MPKPSRNAGRTSGNQRCGLAEVPRNMNSMSGTAEFGPRLDEGVQAARHHRARAGAEQVGAHHAHRHAVEPHLAMKCARLRPRIAHIGAEMILQIAADRQIGGDADAEPAQVLRRPDPGEHQQLRRLNVPAASTTSRAASARTVAPSLYVFDAVGARAVEDDARRLRVDRNGEIRCFPSPA